MTCCLEDEQEEAEGKVCSPSSSAFVPHMTENRKKKKNNDYYLHDLNLTGIVFDRYPMLGGASHFSHTLVAFCIWISRNVNQLDWATFVPQFTLVLDIFLFCLMRRNPKLWVAINKDCNAYAFSHWSLTWYKNLNICVTVLNTWFWI